MVNNPLAQLNTERNIRRSFQLSAMPLSEPGTYNIYEEQKDEDAEAEYMEPQRLATASSESLDRVLYSGSDRLDRYLAEKNANKTKPGQGGELEVYNDPYAGMDMDERKRAIEEREMRKLAAEEVTEFKHQNFSSYMTEQQGKPLEIDWTRAKEKSSVVHIADMVQGWFDEDYVPEHSIAGREIARQDILKEIETLGPAMLSEKDKVKRLKDLWDKNHELRMKNEADQMLIEADAPSLVEMADAIMEHPKETGYAILQAVVDKPELLLVPQVAGARGVLIAGKAAQAVALGARATQVSKLVGGLTAAGLGGLTVGTLDKAIERKGLTGEVDLFRDMEQSQVDALLGTMIWGGGKVFTQGVNSVKARNASYSRVKQDVAESLTHRNIKSAGYYRAVENRVDTSQPDTQIYADPNGNVYQVQSVEILDMLNKKEGLLAMRTKYEQDFEALRALDGELASIETEIKKAGTNIPLDLLQRKVDVSTSILNIEPNQRMMERLFMNAEKEGVDVHNFIQMEDGNGIKHSLRRVTSEMFRTGQAKVDGLPGIVLEDFNPKALAKMPGDLKIAAKGAFISATAPLQDLAKVSPTAKLLVDKFSPNSQAGRAFLETMQEEVRSNQGSFLFTSKEILKKADIAGLKTGEQAHVQLREHMRGVTEHTDPSTLEASAKYRELLDNVAKYAKAKGVKISTSKDFLPRYYDQAKLKTPEARTQLADIVMEHYPTMERNTVERSVLKIYQNLSSETDEVGLMHVGGKIYPIGHRKWDKIPDAALDAFLDDNFVGGLERYILNTVKRTEAESVMGEGGKKLKDFKSQIQKELEEISAGPNDPNARRMSAMEAESIEDLYHLAVGSYGKQTNKSVKKVTDGVMAVTNILSLPLVALTSLTEPLSMLHRLKETSAVAAILDTYTELPMIKQMKASFGDMSYQARLKEFDEMSATNDAATAERALAMTGEGMEGWPAKINTKFMSLNGLHQWTQLTRRKAFEASKRDIIKMAKGLAKGDKPEMDVTRRRELSELGIDPKLVVSWVNRGADITDPVYNRIKKGAMRQTSTIISTPDKFNKAKLLSSNNSILRIAGQYKSFGSTFVNSVMAETYSDVIKLWNEGHKRKALQTYSAGMMALSGMTMWATYNRDMIANGELTGGDDKAKITRKLTTNFAAMAIPGAALLSPFYDSYGASGLVGPAVGTMDRIRSQGIEGVAPSVKKIAEFIDSPFDK